MAGRSSPQEKKRLSYAKDRRNDYGENDKSSRKNIRRNKRVPNRADRHREHQVLAIATGVRIVDEAVELAEAKLLAKKSMWMTKRWRKYRDAPLADIVMNRLRRRVRLGMQDPSAAEARIERVRGRGSASSVRRCPLAQRRPFGGQGDGDPAEAEVDHRGKGVDVADAEAAALDEADAALMPSSRELDRPRRIAAMMASKCLRIRRIRLVKALILLCSAEVHQALR